MWLEFMGLDLIPPVTDYQGKKLRDIPIKTNRAAFERFKCRPWNQFTA